MKYQIKIIKNETIAKPYYDIELHNLEVESNPTNLCFLKLKIGIEESRFQALISFCKQLKIVLGSDICEIVADFDIHEHYLRD